MNNFVNLHVHAEYSLLDGCGLVADFVKKAKKLKQEYLAITDHGNVDGVIKFQEECNKHNIKPVIGCELYIVPDAKKKVKYEKRGHIIVWVKNETGWRNLLHLLTYSNIEGFYYRPRVDFETFLNNCEGLLVSTACVATFINLEGGFEFFEKLSKKLKDDLYLEVMPLDLDIQRELNKTILELSEIYDHKIIATCDAHYIDKEDKETQSVLLAIQSKQKWDDPKRWTFTSSHLLSRGEIKKEFIKQGILNKEQIEEAINNTNEVARKCLDFKIERKGIDLPDLNFGKSLREFCINRFKKKFKKNIKSEKKYYARFKEEISLIESKNFEKYFFIVYDLINYCKNNDIFVGPGRGSVGGCLVAYLLDIHSIDPVKHNLLFSRFLNEDRIDYPDIDIDFPDDRKEDIRNYLESKYGKNSIAGISTFLRMKARNAVRDVARVFDIPLDEVNKFCKVIEDDKIKTGAIKQAILHTEEGRYFNQKYRNVVQHAMKLEGQVRGIGQHAAGIIIAASDLTDSDKCYLKLQNNSRTINWEKDDAEKQGLLKLDVLSLNTLSVLNETKKLIKKNYDTDIDFHSIELENKDIIREFAKGRTSGIFQYNTYGMIKFLKEMKPKVFEDLVAANALYRPGPLQSGIAKEYIERMHGRKYKEKSPIIEEITKNTYSSIIYQEQVMFIANQLAGMSYRDADKLRKLISKSKGIDALHEWKDKFIDGALKNQKELNKNDLEKLWTNIEKFGKYSFNRSHSFAYSLLGLWTMWIKLHFPSEFICAALTKGNEGNKADIIKDAKRLGLEIVTPKVGISDPFIWIVKDEKLYCPFIEVKGIGEKTAEKSSKMKSVNDCSNRNGFFNKRKVTVKEKKGLEKILDEIGAFECENIRTEKMKKYFTFSI